MSARPLGPAIAFALAFCTCAKAGPIVDRIKSSGVIRCGGVPRPGLVNRPADGAPSGLYLDLCRAMGAALLGPAGRIEFHPYDSDRAFARVADGADDLFFLDGSEIADHRLASAATLGPAVYFVSTAAMVHEPAESIQRLSDLAGKSICFYQGDNAHLNLEASMAARRLDFVRMGYMEYGELHDAYNSGVCDARVGESGDLAAARLEEHSAPASRILIEPLATFPVFAATPASDPQWSAIVAWSTYALQRAELPATPWTAGRQSLAVEGRDLGLAEDWGKRVVGAAGSYADIYARNLGDGSPLKLPRGPNAPAELGGLFVTPFRE